MSKATFNVGSVTRTGSGRKRKIDGFDVEIEGLEELIKAFAELGPNAILKLGRYTVDAAELVATRARANINDKTGELSSAIKVYKPGGSSRSKITGKAVDKKAYRVFSKVGFSKKGMHGVPLELGHRLWYFGKKTNRDVEEKPFLRPAADESKDEVRDIIAGAMNKILEEWGD